MGLGLAVGNNVGKCSFTLEVGLGVCFGLGVADATLDVGLGVCFGLGVANAISGLDLFASCCCLFKGFLRSP